MKRNRILIMIGCAIGTLSIVALTTSQIRPNIRESHLVKLVMPGGYKVELAKKTYQVWAFDKWPSKHIDGQFPNNDELSIQGASGRIKVMQFAENAAAMYENHRNGKLIGSIEPVRDDIYDITCSASCVVVLVPPDAVQSNLGSNFEVNGLDNDFGFVQHP
ncbi:MAG TPA: hypothetical protein V6C86_25680 [Oculatellaceae cyanobacterium]